MKLTIDNMDGLGETDYTALLDAEAPPKIVRKLNQASAFSATLVCKGKGVSARAGSKVRLYRDSGGLWFSGYLKVAPKQEFLGVQSGVSVFRITLNAAEEMSALDRSVLSEHAAIGGCTAGEVISSLARETNVSFDLSGVQNVAEAGTVAVESGEVWSAIAEQLANGSRSALSAENRALTMTPVGTVIRTLAEGDPGFSLNALNLTASGPTANDITVIGVTEPAMYVRDCFTATGKQKALAMSRLPFKLQTAIAVEDDFHGAALDTSKWVNDSPVPLTFVPGGIACAGATALRYRDRLELGGLIILEQTGISYTSGQGIIGGLYDGGFAVNLCIAGVMLVNGEIVPVINGATNASVGQLSSSKLYEFRTMLFHPEPIRAGQVYSSSICNGANARSSQVWIGTTHVVLTMREIDPAEASTTSTPQVVIYDGTLLNVPAYADYEPLWGTNLSCTLGHAQVANEGAVWVQSAAPGKPWRTRLIGDVTAGAECFMTSTPELHFSSSAEPVAGEQVEVFYRARGLACGRVIDSQSVQALQNTEDNGTRSMVIHVTAPAPRTSLDCEQAARALLDDLTQVGYSGEYQVVSGSVPQGASDVQPGEQWNISSSTFGVNCSLIVREVELQFLDLSDQYAQFKLQVADDAAGIFACKFGRTKHNQLITVVSSELQEDVSTRIAGLPDARITTWGTTSLTVDAGTDPVAGGGFEVRVEGDWGWGMTADNNLIGCFSSRIFTLPNAPVTQDFYLRQYDGSVPPKYSPYTSILHLEV